MAVTLGFALYMLWQFEPGDGTFQFVENQRWIPALGVRYIVGVDGISLFMVVITALLFPIGLLASEKYIEHRAEGVHRLVPDARGRHHGDLPLPRPHRVLRLLGAAARPDVLPHPGMGERAPRVRGDEVLHLHRGRVRRSCSRRRSCSGSCTRATPASSRSTTACSRSGTGSSGTTELLAVPRVHGRVRDQGAAVPVPHVAARRAHRGADRGLGRAGRRDHEDGRLRLRAVLVRAVPAGVGRPGADPDDPRGDRDHLRRDRRRDADRPEADHRVLVGRAHGLRRARHLLAHRSSASTARCSRWCRTRSPPARCSSSSACSTSAATRASCRRTAASGRSRPCSAACSSPRCSPASACPGFSGFVGEFLSLLGAFVWDRPYAIVATVRRDPRRGLHALGVPARVHRRADGRERRA